METMWSNPDKVKVLFTALLSLNLSDFCEKNIVLTKAQADFRNVFGSADHIFSLYSIIDFF